MAISLQAPDIRELKPRITVFGVGGAGGNAVNNMIDKQLEGCEFVVANTDAPDPDHRDAGAEVLCNRDAECQCHSGVRLLCPPPCFPRPRAERFFDSIS